MLPTNQTYTYLPIGQIFQNNQNQWNAEQILFVLFGGWILYDFISKRF